MAGIWIRVGAIFTCARRVRGRRGTGLVVWGVAVVAALLLPRGVARAAEVEDAEYAVRWDVAASGPKTAKETLEVLATSAQDTDDYTVQYFELTAPADAPAGFDAILRQRQKKKKSELTFKYRGDKALATWNCPLPEPSETQAEVDVSILSTGTRRVHSYSCTVEKSGTPPPPPAALQATPKPCSSKMKRVKADGLKVEEWELPGGIRMIEVSQKGKASQADLEKFQKNVVDRLLKHGITPLDRSKSELGGSCPGSPQTTEERIMPNPLLKVTIKGRAGLEFRVIPRDRGDEPPPPVIDAALKADGSAEVYIPGGYYVVVAQGVSTQVIDPGAGAREVSVKLE